MLESVDQWFIYCLEKYGFDVEFLVLAIQGDLSFNIIKKFIVKMPQCLISPHNRNDIDVQNIYEYYIQKGKSYYNTVKLLKEGIRCEGL